MFENMFFLDSEHIGMERILQKITISIEWVGRRRKEVPVGEIPPILPPEFPPKEYPFCKFTNNFT